MSNVHLQDAWAISKFIKDADKKTPVKLYIKGKLENLKALDSLKVFGDSHHATVFGNIEFIKTFLKENQALITDQVIETDRRNSAIPLLDISKINARIEPGAHIREHVHIGDKAVIMMGAVLNIGASIGEGTMIDMNAVIGARGSIGKNCHLGAGAVLAGVLEPPSATPVIVEDNVVIGANAVILEGVRVKEGAIIAAGSIVTKDVEKDTVVGGVPARYIKDKDEQTRSKTHILDDLRG